MSYQVGYLDVLRALFFPLDPLMIALVFLVPLVLLISMPWALKAAGKWPRYWWLLPGIIALLIVIFLSACLPQIDSGWQLTDSRFRLKAWPVSTTLDVSAVRVALVESSSPWRPVMRTNGYGTPGLTTGWCKLANGKKAVVFRHLRHDKMLVLEAGGRYYIVTHPGVEKLHETLIAQGAKRWESSIGERKGDV
jgi:hypothetical protein